MKKILILLIILISSISVKSQDLPKYLIENGDTIGIVLSIEQAQKLNKDSELLTLFRQLNVDCDKLDISYVKVINSLDQKVALLEFNNRNLKSLNLKNDSLVKNLQEQVNTVTENKNLCDEQLGLKKEENEILKEQLKKEKFRKFLSITGNVALTVIVLLVIL
jgi:predicted RNase H-like nuclease (RuvC/YqgF family)